MQTYHLGTSGLSLPLPAPPARMATAPALEKFRHVEVFQVIFHDMEFAVSYLEYALEMEGISLPAAVAGYVAQLTGNGHADVRHHTWPATLGRYPGLHAKGAFTLPGGQRMQFRSLLAKDEPTLRAWNLTCVYFMDDAAHRDVLERVVGGLRID